MNPEPLNVGLQMLWDEFVFHTHELNTTYRRLSDDLAGFRAAYLVAADIDDAWIFAMCYQLVLDAYCEALNETP